MIPPPDAGLTVLGGLTPREFLGRHWQRRPLLVRGALPDWRSPVGVDDVADLACDEEFESRLVIEDARPRWSVRHGPFDPGELRNLPGGGWSLLVHGVERVAPGVAALQEHFDFIPRWRFDDVLASVAPPGGSVGPYVDPYDVFLVQAVGRRRWRRSARRIPEGDEPLIEEADARVLASFTCDEEDILEPGDLLYLPPGVPRHGVALDECVTLSVGFRAPDVRELAARLLGQLLDEVPGGPRYVDPGRLPADRPGHVAPADLETLIGLVRDALADDEAARRRVGAALTEPRSGPADEDDAPSLAEIRDVLRSGGALRRATAGAVAWTWREDDGITLFAGGESHDLPAWAIGAVESLCGVSRLDEAALRPWFDDPRLGATLGRLLATGTLIRCGPQSP